jgi:uncharacterized protein (TIGR02271 family)
MEPRITRDQFAEGMDVFGADGDKVGTIVTVGTTYLVVEKGFFFPTDYYIPLAAIARIDRDDDAVWLTVSKDEALRQGWDVVPTTDVAAEAAAATTATAHVVDWTGTPAASTRGTTVMQDDNDTVVVPVHEEALTATRTPVERGAVRIAKDVVAEEQALDVPVTEEQVHVERRAVDRPVDPGEDAFQERVIEVPIRGEEVVLEKQARVVEEIELTKEAVHRTEQVRGTVRREQVWIGDDTAGGDVGMVDTDAAVIEPGPAIDDADTAGRAP